MERGECATRTDAAGNVPSYLTACMTVGMSAEAGCGYRSFVRAGEVSVVRDCKVVGFRVFVKGSMPAGADHL